MEEFPEETEFISEEENPEESTVRFLEDELEIIPLSFPVDASRPNSIFVTDSSKLRESRIATEASTVYSKEQIEQEEDTRFKVLLTHGLVPGIALKKLEPYCQLITVNEGDSVQSIFSYASGVAAIFLCDRTLRVDGYFLDHIGDSLKVVGAMSGTYDFIDFIELKRRGIRLGSTRSIITDYISEFALGLALSAAYHIILPSKKDSDDEILCKELFRSVCGVIGLGKIGMSLAQRLVIYGVEKILYSGHKEKPEAAEVNAEFVPLNELLERSDFVFVCCPVSVETRNLIDINAMERMKSTAVLVSISRDGVVNLNDLALALKKHSLLAAGIDVSSPLAAQHPLLSAPNCLVTPGLCTATISCREEMAVRTAENILAALQGEKMPEEICFHVPQKILERYNYCGPKRMPAKLSLKMSSEIQLKHLSKI